MADKVKTIELFKNVSTEGREMVTKIVNFDGFLNIRRADLKTTLHANDGIDSGIGLPTEWRITKIVVNNKTFYPSQKLTSDNKIHDAGGSAFFKEVLKVNDVNTISIHWIAPFGAGVTSPHGAVSAVLEVYGDAIPFAEDLQFDPTNAVTEANQFFKNASLPTALMIIAIMITLALLGWILLRAPEAIKSTSTLVKEVKK